MLAKAKRRWSLLWAARFVAKWEGFEGTAYLDTIADPAVYTIGYGHTGGVHAGETITRGQAKRLLARDLRSAAGAVDRKVHVRLTARRRIALISIVFNCGPGVLDDSEIIGPLNRKRFSEAARHMLNWDHAGGVVVEGLSRRRHAEAWLMTHPKARQHRPPQKPTPTHHKAHKRPRKDSK